MVFHTKKLDELFCLFNSCENGLSSSQAEKNKELFGSNEQEVQKKQSFIKKFLAQFKNLMIVILIISASISIFMAITHHDKQNLFEGILIFAIVFINAFVGVVQEQKAENAIEALKNQTLPTAKIIRNGNLVHLPMSEIVVGDVIVLKTGDYVPADIRIISSNDLKCNESSLTGESIDVSKSAENLHLQNTPISEQKNMCFAGTTILSGTAKGLVCAVGKNTEIGKIAKNITESKKEKTPLEKNIDKIGKVLTIGILIIVAIVFLVQVLFGKNISVLQALLTAVALAVAAIPESLPAVITIIMALGVQRLAKENAIVKKLSAVETLGCCNVICTDKTGTLTENKMSVKHIFSSNTLFDASKIDTAHIGKLIDICVFCNYDTDSTTTNPTESAILKFLMQNNVNFSQITSNSSKISKTDFNSINKYKSVTICKNGETFLIVQGAIDCILQKCSYVLIDGQVNELTDSIKQNILLCNESVCLSGERVLAFAEKHIQDNSNFDELVFVGFAAITDPPKMEVYDVIKSNRLAGIKTIMITGDHPATALAIAKSLGIADSKKDVLTGFDIDHMKTTDLSKIISNYSVFARVTPEHKLQIVQALKQCGNIVAMTGDGINDAPSIKAANIGVCMGQTGTDVTKEVSDIIISDDKYSSITSAIKQGRTIYQNISKTILFLLSTNIVEVLGIFITALIMPSVIFLLPSQILFINLVTDSLPAFALGIEPAEKNIMHIPPRGANKSLLSGKIGASIIYQGFIQSLIVLVVFVVSIHVFSDIEARTMVFLIICLMQIIHAINCKTEKSIFKVNILKNRFFNLSFVLLLALILAVYFITPLSITFSLCKLNFTEWAIVILSSLLIIPAVELGKIFIKE